MITILRDKIRSLHWSQWLSLFGLAVLFVALRWNNFNAPFIRDEGECDYAAQLLVQGIAPYQHAFIQKPPGVVYAYALANLLLPQHFWAPRLLAYLFVALATGLLGVIAWLEFGEGFALIAMWLMTPMILLPGIDQYSCNPEMFLLLPLLATVAIYCYSRRHGHKKRHWFLAGFLAATALIFKYTALPILGLFSLVWLIEMYQSGSSAAAVFRAFFCSMLGVIIAAVLALGFYAAHGALPQLGECTVIFNRYYIHSGAFSQMFLWSELKVFWDSWWILFLIPWAAVLQPRRRILFWVGICACAVVATSGCSYTQYYILVMPFWALLAAAGIAALASEISIWIARPAAWIARLVTAVVLLLVVRSDVPYMLCSSQRFAAADGYLFVEARAMAGHVAAMSSPSDYVYVAGSDPEILCYAQRFSPTRFITTYPLMIPNPSAAAYQDNASRDLQRRPPKLIVFVATGDSWIRHTQSPTQFLDFLNDFLRQKYNLVGGFVRTSDEKSYWSQPMTIAQFKDASMLLFELKH